MTPTKPGHYWWRQKGEDEWEMVEERAEAKASGTAFIWTNYAWDALQEIVEELKGENHGIFREVPS